MSKLNLMLLIFVFLWRYSAGLSPVIFIPGLAAGQLEAKYNKPEVVYPWCQKVESNYYTIWVNFIEISSIDCLVDNIRLDYNNLTRKTKDSPGVEIRVSGWGTTETVEWLDPLHVLGYFHVMADALVAIGYVRDISLRGAPYDFRKAANENEDFFVMLKALVEETYTINDNTAITLLTHSMGGSMAQHFLTTQTQEWKDQYIKRLIAMATPYGGAMEALQAFATGIDITTLLKIWRPIRTLARTLPSVAWLLPSSLFWGPTEVLVQTPMFNYTINDMQKLFLDLNLPNAWEMRKDTEALTGNYIPPGVDLYCLYGTGVPTVSKLVYEGVTWEDDDQPDVEYGDGDGIVNIRSLTGGCERWQNRDGISTLNQGYPVTSVSFYLAEHITMMYDVRVIEYVMSILASD